MFDSKRYIDEYVQVLLWLDAGVFERMAAILLGAWVDQRTVFLCGNGGSAASACHIAADLTKLTAPPSGPRLRVVSLTESGAAISAIANDLAYEEIFAEQLRASMQKGDVVIGLSTSGSSPNVLRAVEYARAAGGTTLGITGHRGRELQARAHLSLVVPSESVQHIEDATMVVGHMLCLSVRMQIQAEYDLGMARMAAKPVLVVPPYNAEQLLLIQAEYDTQPIQAVGPMLTETAGSN